MYFKHNNTWGKGKRVGGGLAGRAGCRRVKRLIGAVIQIKQHLG